MLTRGLMLGAAWFVLSCGRPLPAANPEAPFEPKSGGAFLNYFGSQVLVRLTEVDPAAIGYSHVPRSLHLVAAMGNEPGGTYRLVRATDGASLASGAATLRVVEYGALPRVFQLTRGTLRIEEVPSVDGHSFGRLVLHLDAVLSDPIDGSPDLKIQGDYPVDVDGIT